MGKIFNVLGACALITSCIAVSSCDQTYDEDELNSDIQKKLNEKKAAEEAAWLAKTTDIIVLAGDTLTLPARVTPQKTEEEQENEESYNSQFVLIHGVKYSDDYYHCYFDPSDKDAIKKKSV